MDYEISMRPIRKISGYVYKSYNIILIVAQVFRMEIVLKFDQQGAHG